MVTGSRDVSPATGQGPDWRLQVWERLGAEPRWLLFLEGADHGLGGVGGGRGRSASPTLDRVVAATTAFWQATLRGDPAARAALDASTLGPGAPLPAP